MALDTTREMLPVAVALPSLAENGIAIVPAANEVLAWKVIREPAAARLRGKEFDAITPVGGVTLVMVAGLASFTVDGVNVATKELPG